MAAPTGPGHAARYAVIAAALTLAGVALAAAARWSAVSTGDAVRAEATAAADRLGALTATALVTARVRAEGLAAMPTVRAAVETDVATVRDMARAEGFVFVPAARETIEIFQLAPRRRPLSLLRQPETAATLAIGRADEVRVEERGGALVVLVAAPSAPLYAHGGLTGAVAVATRVDLAPVTATLRASGIAAQLEGIGEPVVLSAPLGDGRSVLVPVPLGDAALARAPRLSLRASVHAGGGALLWAGRLLLVCAFASALLAFVAHRRRSPAVAAPAPSHVQPEPQPWTPMQEMAREWIAAGSSARRMPMMAAPAADSASIDLEADTELNAPRLAVPAMPTTKEKRGDADKRNSDGNHLVLAWSANMPTPITRLEPLPESAPIAIDPRGDQLGGRYRLLSPLGRGSSAEVYLAQSFTPSAPGTVALKLLTGAPTPERAAYLDAARRQLRVAHANIAQVLDVGDTDVAYVAMEYVEGCTLECLLRDLFARDEPMPLPQTVTIMAALCRALDAARPLVHGAVKPSNVLVGRHNQVKLADFAAPPSATDRHAPEQYAGRAADRRSDVFAAGLILHELLTARRMEAPSGDARRWPPLPAPSSLRPGLPRDLDAIVAKATRFGPRGRYATAGELLADLLHVTEPLMVGTTTAWLGDFVERARHS
jgi:protein kinase-like protein